MVSAYADHNFLIHLIENAESMALLLTARDRNLVQMVLSPWHFYEYGNGAAHPDTERILDVVERLNPQWILPRADAQMIELSNLWNQIWESATERFVPVGPLPYIIALMQRVDVRSVLWANMRDFVRVFAEVGALIEIQATMDWMRNVAASNRRAYSNHRFTRSIRRQIEIDHVANQLACIRRGRVERQQIDEEVRQLRNDRLMWAKITQFVDWALTRKLECYQTEAELSHDLYRVGGELGRNRFIDREHACIALPYCDYCHFGQDTPYRVQPSQQAPRFPDCPNAESGRFSKVAH